MKGELTLRQRDVLAFVKEYIAEQGYPPTVREVAVHFGIDQMSALFHLNALARKGYIKREKNRPRAIRLIETPPKQENITTIPILGEVPAGKPFIAEENFEGKILIDKSLVRGKKLFALKVKGNSMIEAHILPGDVAIVQQQPTAQNGDIVVVLLKNSRTGDYEATVKRLLVEKNFLILKPENRNMRPIVINTKYSEAKILGKVIAVYRNL